MLKRYLLFNRPSNNAFYNRQPQRISLDSPNTSSESLKGSNRRISIRASQTIRQSITRTSTSHRTSLPPDPQFLITSSNQPTSFNPIEEDESESSPQGIPKLPDITQGTPVLTSPRKWSPPQFQTPLIIPPLPRTLSHVTVQRTHTAKELVAHTRKNTAHATIQNQLREMEDLIAHQERRNYLAVRNEKLVAVHSPDIHVREVSLWAGEEKGVVVPEIEVAPEVLVESGGVAVGGVAADVSSHPDSNESMESGSIAPHPIPLQDGPTDDELSDVNPNPKVDAKAVELAQAALHYLDMKRSVQETRGERLMHVRLTQGNDAVLYKSRHYRRQAKELQAMRHELNLPVIPVSKRYEQWKQQHKVTPPTIRTTISEVDCGLNGKAMHLGSDTTRLGHRATVSTMHKTMSMHLPLIDKEAQAMRLSIMAQLKRESFNEASVYHTEQEFLNFKKRYQKPDTPPKHPEPSLENLLKKVASRKETVDTMFKHSLKNVERTNKFSQGFGVSGGRKKRGSVVPPNQLHLKFANDLYTIPKALDDAQLGDQEPRPDSGRESVVDWSRMGSMIPDSRRESDSSEYWQDYGRRSTVVPRRMELIKEASRNVSVSERKRSISVNVHDHRPSLTEIVPQNARDLPLLQPLVQFVDISPSNTTRRRSLSTNAAIGLTAIKAAFAFKKTSTPGTPSPAAAASPSTQAASLFETERLATPPHLRLSRNPSSIGNTIENSRNPSLFTTGSPKNAGSPRGTGTPTRAVSLLVPDSSRPGTPTLTKSRSESNRRINRVVSIEMLVIPPEDSDRVDSVFSPIRILSSSKDVVAGTDLVKSKWSRHDLTSIRDASTAEAAEVPDRCVYEKVRWQPLTMASTSERAKTMYPSSVNNCDRYKKEIEDLELLARNPNVGSRVWEGTFVKSVYGEAVVDNTKRKKKKDVPDVVVPKYVRVWAGEKDRFFVKEKGGHIPFTTRPPTPQPEPPPPPVQPVEEVVLTEVVQEMPEKIPETPESEEIEWEEWKEEPVEPETAEIAATEVEQDG
ncbi:hypothetical protein HDU79_005015 [Rhizoclosmatium sp. JEL0117]|nr:hypothetical protein HDU79_005015 [Rhizoclosmatium sp. JEL0117]